MKKITKKRSVIIRSDDLNDIDVASTNCCGIYELHNLSGKAWANIFKLCRELDDDYNLVIFHDATRFKNGERLARLIRTHRLGKLVATKIVYNPNSSNMIRMWTFYPNWIVIRQLVNGAETINDDDMWYSYDYKFIPK